MRLLATFAILFSVSASAQAVDALRIPRCNPPPTLPDTTGAQPFTWRAGGALCYDPIAACHRFSTAAGTSWSPCIGATACATVTTVVQIPILGISNPSTVSIPAAKAGSPCFVGQRTSIGLARAECTVPTDGNVELRFIQSGLAAILTIPSQTYTACVTLVQ